MISDDSQADMEHPRTMRRHRRADEQRRRALSPVRILLMVLALPVTISVIAVGTYLRVSDNDRPEAIIHLVALAGCDAARALGFGTFREGEPGYHARNDPDGDGVACDHPAPSTSLQQVQPRNAEPKARMVGNAKFVRP